MRRLAWLLLLFLILFFQQVARGQGCILRVDLEGVIHPVTVDILDRAFEQAQHDGCGLIVVRLNTPGGLAEAARASVERMTRAPAPVVVWVAPGGSRAASAGLFLLLAGDKAFMAPGTNTGAAHPVMLVGSVPDPVMSKKIENDTAAWIRSLAGQHKRNVELAEAAVRDSRSFTEKEALDGKLIDAIVAREEDIPAAAGKPELASARRIVYERTLAQRLEAALSDPNLALVFLVLGLLGLYIEFTTPGVILPGVLGGILTILGLSALAVLPFSWAGAGLLLLAVALFVLEAKVVSHGVLGAGGAVAMVLGALMLVNGPIPEMRVHLSTALGLSLPFAAIVVALVTLVVRARLRPPETGMEGMIGLTAVAVTPLDPEGHVLVHGELWRARADKPIARDIPVRVKAVDGLELRVESMEGSTNVHSG